MSDRGLKIIPVRKKLAYRPDFKDSIEKIFMRMKFFSRLVNPLVKIQKAKTALLSEPGILSASAGWPTSDLPVQLIFDNGETNVYRDLRKFQPEKECKSCLTLDDLLILLSSFHKGNDCSISIDQQEDHRDGDEAA